MVGRVKGTFWRWKVKENTIFFINLSEQILTFCHILHKGPGAGSSHEMKRKKRKNRSKPFGTNHQNLLMWHSPGSSEQGHSRFYVKRQHTAKGAKAKVRLASPSEPGDNVLLRAGRSSGWPLGGAFEVLCLVLQSLEGLVPRYWYTQFRFANPKRR